MTEKGMLILSKDLIERVDQNRGDLSREEFIDFCIDMCLEKGEAEPAEKPEGYGAEREPTMRTEEKGPSAYATVKEFQEFKRGMADILRTFLEFFITFGLELGKGKGIEDIDYLKTRLRKIIED